MYDFDKPKNRLALAINIKSWDHPSLMMLGNDGVLYYAGYFQNIGEYDPDYHEIVKSYGFIDFNDDDQFDALEIQFTQDFPPDEGIDDILTGWITPDGKFFPCSYREHDSMGIYAYKYVNKKIPDGVKQLELEGWARVNKTNVKYNHAGDLTKAQIDTLSEIYVKTDDEQFKMLYKWMLEEREENEHI